MSLENNETFRWAQEEIYGAVKELKDGGMGRDKLLSSLDTLVKNHRAGFKDISDEGIRHFDAVITRVKQRIIKDYNKE